jgi:hypothetical protein
MKCDVSKRSNPMRTAMMILALVVLAIGTVGCAAGIKAGGDRGVGAGAALGPVPSPGY